MKFNTNKTKLQFTFNGTFIFSCEVPGNLADKLNALCNKDVLKSIEIKQHREKRSLDSNSYFWSLCHQVAKVLSSTDQEVYEQMLHDYGTSEYLVVKADTIAKLKTVYKIVDIVSKVQVNGKDAVQVKCIRGSSSYNSLEMSRLIEGMVNECKTLGIETLSPNELKTMIGEMEK